MKPIFSLKPFIIILTFTVLLSADIIAAQPETDSTKMVVAKEFLNLIVAQDFTKAMTYIDWDLAGKINAAALQNIWKNLQVQSGAFKTVVDFYSEQKDDFTVVFQTCQFEKSMLDCKTTINSQNKIAGLFFSMPKSKEIYRLPAYANTSEILETEITIKSGAYELPAILSYPKNGSHFPAVVLVHGSGPNDKDESIGPNKIFKDLAYGLAAKGIAVLRYDKRTLIYNNEMKALLDADKLTINDETIDDAVAAVKALKSIVAVDSNKVFVAGHSLGAMVTPQIATACNVKGIILMAGNARPVEDLILEQTEYLAGLNGNTADSKAQIDQVKTQVLNVKSLSKESDIDSWQLPLGLPKNYWLSLNNYKQCDVIKKLALPILIIQGGRDYQVTMTDFNLWKKSLSSRNDVTYKPYEKLNHLFIEGTGKSNPSEYSKSGNVAPYVIDDLAGFILKKP